MKKLAKIRLEKQSIFLQNYSSAVCCLVLMLNPITNTWNTLALVKNVVMPEFIEFMEFIERVWQRLIL